MKTMTEFLEEANILVNKQTRKSALVFKKEIEKILKRKLNR